MLPGFSGHLVAEAYLEAQPETDPRAIERARREMVEWRATRQPLGPATTVGSLLEVAVTPLGRALGFDAPGGTIAAGSALAATLRANGRPVALIVTPWADRLDAYWRLAVTEARRRAATWCLLCNGVNIRIVDANRLYARRVLDFDLDLAIDSARVFAALWRASSAAALGADADDPRSLHSLVAESDRHAACVCRSLRDGVRAASADVLGALVARGRATRGHRADDAFEQALTIVYRILFLLFAEARALVPLCHPIYRESYSIEALRDAAEHSPRSPGLWDALRAIARLAHAGCRAGDLRVTPFNGRLFSPARTPLAERRDLDDDAARRAVLSLSTRRAPDGEGRERIAYRDLGVEQLGAVYETLLDYRPRIEPLPRARGGPAARVSLERGSGARKSTGSFYTPQPLADYLVRRTLAPLVAAARPEDILGLRIVDPAMGSGAFLVAACRYLATAYEHALVAAGRCHASDVTERDRVSIRRAIAERCLYGVDLNPMAVQLARLSIWLATLAADQPLTFLDHRLTAGDSLVGAWVENLRRPPRPGRRAGLAPLPLFTGDEAGEALRAALPLRFSLESMPNDTLEGVRAKERALAALTARDSALSRWKRVADVWCAAWFPTGGASVPAAAFGALSDHILHGTGQLSPRVAAGYLRTGADAAAERRFFHWELEFPEVFFDGAGRRLPQAGFDAVLGNPPWDMLRADAGENAVRRRARDETSRIVRFTREAGVYAFQSDGHANRYQLFLERAIALTRAGGRLGLVLPAGLATDHGSASLRRMLLTRCDVDALVGIDNRHGVFPIHRGVGFLLATASVGSRTQTMACRFGVDAVSTLETIGSAVRGGTEDSIDGTGAEAVQSFPVHLSLPVIERLSGPSLAIPHLRSAVDLVISERAAALFSPLGDDRGWRARFGRELNATDDKDVFRPAGRGLPVVDGKHIEPFRVTTGASVRSVMAADARRLLGEGRFDRVRLAYRDVASATNRLTLIAALLPAGCVSTHTVFCLRTPLAPSAQYLLCGLFNSFVLNFLVRLRVTTHVTTAVVERLPLPTIEAAPVTCREIAALARLLSRRHDAAAHAALNARVAELYQLTAPEFEYILGTFPLIPADDRQAALAMFTAGLGRSLR
jgi:hypothetical protein